jgi:branched-chain amino acid transport system ATP-binding protein
MTTLNLTPLKLNNATLKATFPLQVNGISMAFGGLMALKNISFTATPGEIVGLIGPNGAGKTTVFNILTGVYKPTLGSVVLGNKTLSKLSSQKICHAGVSRTFQNIRLFSKQTVFENIEAGLVGKNYSGLNFFLPKRQPQDLENLKLVIEFLGLQDVQNELATSLPYGLQRKVEIGRALMTMPQVLLLDEPAAGMNPTEKTQLSTLVRQIAQLGLTLLIIEHDMKFVMSLCQKIHVLDHGEKIAEGTPEEVRKNSKVIEAYLGVEHTAGELA